MGACSAAPAKMAVLRRCHLWALSTTGRGMPGSRVIRPDQGSAESPRTRSSRTGADLWNANFTWGVSTPPLRAVKLGRSYLKWPSCCASRSGRPSSVDPGLLMRRFSPGSSSSCPWEPEIAYL